MSKVLSAVIINKPIEEVFDYAASPVNGPAFIPNLNENTNIYPDTVGVGQTFDYRFNMVGVDLRGKAEVTEFERPNKVKINSTGDSVSSWLYTFEKEGEGTKVTVELEYEFSETAWKRLASKTIVDKLAQKICEQMTESLKIILES
jgi:uncharacterized membrane protein